MNRILRKVKLQYLYDVNAGFMHGLCSAAGTILNYHEHKLFKEYLHANLLKDTKQFYMFNDEKTKLTTEYAFKVTNRIDRIKWLNEHIDKNK